MLRRALTIFGAKKAEPLLSGDAFTAAVVAAIQAALPELKIEVTGPLSFVVQVPGDADPQDAQLERFYDMYQQEPSLFELIVKLQVSAQSDLLTLASLTMTADMVIPLVRSFRDLEGFDETTAVFESLTADLVIVYAFDLPHTLQYLSPQSLEQIGVSREELATVAIANMEARAGSAVVEVEDGIAFITAETFSVSSLLVCSAFWRQGLFEHSPHIAVFAPDRDLLIAVDATEQDSVADGLVLANGHLQASSAPLSCELFMVRSDEAPDENEALVDAAEPDAVVEPAPPVKPRRAAREFKRLH